MLEISIRSQYHCFSSRILPTRYTSPGTLGIYPTPAAADISAHIWTSPIRKCFLSCRYGSAAMILSMRSRLNNTVHVRIVTDISSWTKYNGLIFCGTSQFLYVMKFSITVPGFLRYRHCNWNTPDHSLDGSRGSPPAFAACPNDASNRRLRKRQCTFPGRLFLCVSNFQPLRHFYSDVITRMISGCFSSYSRTISRVPSVEQSSPITNSIGKFGVLLQDPLDGLRNILGMVVRDHQHAD